MTYLMIHTVSKIVHAVDPDSKERTGVARTYCGANVATTKALEPRQRGPVSCPLCTKTMGRRGTTAKKSGK